MPTLNKLEYLNETKQQIKGALNTNFNSGITDSDTFRSYVSKITDIYTNWPKATGTGTDLELTPTKKGKMQIGLKGNSSQDGEPTPDTPYPVKVVTGENSLVISTKNKVDFSTVRYADSNGGVVTKNGGEYTIVNGADTDYGSVRMYPSLKPNTTYTFSARVKATTNSNGSCVYIASSINTTGSQIWGSRATAGNRSYATFTTPNEISTSNNAFIGLYPRGSNVSATFDEIMIEENSTMSDYVEYEEQNYQLSLGDIELCKIGDYQDYIYKNGDNWYKKQLIGKIVFNGSEDWLSNTTSTDGTKVNVIEVNNYLRINSEMCICNYFTSDVNGGYGAITYGKVHFRYAVGDNRKYLYFGSNMDISDWESWLSTHNTIVYYALNTSTDVQITDTTLISQLNNIYENAHSYKGTTNITSTYEDGNEQMIIEASALMEGGN